MEQASIHTYWLPSEIRQEQLPVAPRNPKPHINLAHNTGDSMATYNGMKCLGEYLHENPQANQVPEPQPIAQDYEALHYKLQALTQANLEAYQVHLQPQAVPPSSFQDFAARCPPPGQKLYFDEERGDSQCDGGGNRPTGFHWEVCSSKLSEARIDEERPITAYENQGMMQWNVAESILTISEPDIQLKRPWDSGYESARKRVCKADRSALPTERPMVNDLVDLFPFEWEFPRARPIQSSNSDVSPFYLPTPELRQGYWDNWQPEHGYEHYHHADVNFAGLRDYKDMIEMESVLSQMQEPELKVSPAHAWLLDQIMLPKTITEPHYEEPQHLALTPMPGDTPQYVGEASIYVAPAPQIPMFSDAADYVESPLPMTPMFNDVPGYATLTNQLSNLPFPAVNAGWSEPVSGRPIPPWRMQKVFADAQNGEKVLNALPLPSNRCLRMKALDLLQDFEEHPVPDIADILPLKQKIRPAQDDILNWKFFSQGLPLAKRRNKQVQHLKLFWNSKATHDVHPHFHSTQAVRAC